MKKLILLLSVVVAIAACKKNDDGKEQERELSVLETEYFTVDGADYKSSALPEATSDEQFSNVGINGSVLNGGSSIVTVESASPLEQFFVAVQGVEGYLVFDARPAPQTRAAGGNVYQFTLLLSQLLTGDFTVMVGAIATDGTILRLYTHRFSLIVAGTGSLQVNLSFNQNKDVDLHLELPDGSVIDYDTDGYWDGTVQVYGLDIDSNAACSIDAINSENIFFPEEWVMNGKYTVYANMYANCAPHEAATQWVVTAIYNGRTLIPSFGRNPQSGSFDIDEPNNGYPYGWDGAVKVMEFTISGAARDPGDEMYAGAREGLEAGTGVLRSSSKVK